ncbi:type II/III secretion system protein [Caballeronia calidae]|uniref:Type II/III secretion system protein n=1 Tax=Caballeronia calidae TaxID=1777139 RepID=A0A158DHN4_9BURK|nr:type IV pilus secretin PilQ [Caballeronia calidae]SAK94119.1 type II/III secretion system protein [Caballeronia calidae]
MSFIAQLPRRFAGPGAALLLCAHAALAAENADAIIAPLPPLPASFDGQPAGRLALDTTPPPVAQNADATPAAKPAADPPDAPEALEGPPVPLPKLERLSSAAHETDSGKPITLDLKNADLSTALQALARFSGLNIVASDKVRGQVSMNLVAVPWRRAFDTLLEVNGLAMEQHGNVIWVAPLAELAAREKLRFEAHARAADLEPLASRTFVLRYSRAEDLRKTLTGTGSQRVLSKRGSAIADARTNLLFVTDLDARVQQIAELVALIDKPTPQVMIEARIVEGEAGLSRNLGVKLGVAPQNDPSTGFSGGKDGVVYDLSAGPINGFDAATAGLTLFVAQATRLLNIELSALEAEGRGQIVSRPRVVTADRVKSVVEQGMEVPYQAKVGNGMSGVQFRRATLKLEVEPQITPHGHVILDLDITKDSLGEQTANGPAIHTKHVQTRVEVENGGTVAIGGIYSDDERQDTTGVPALSKLPLIGWLFRHDARRSSKSELVILITPHVIASGG